MVRAIHANGYRHTAEVMKALAHPIRLQILELLESEGEACVCHLEVLLDRRQAYISQQLSILRQAGLVSDRREGMNVFYAPSDQAVSLLAGRARSLAKHLARSEGFSLSFPETRPSSPETCSCPKCAVEAGRSG